jgi:hypothetical protein
MMKLLLMLGAAFILTLGSEAAPKPQKLTPAQEKASQFRAWEREDVKAARRKKLSAWFLRKASGKNYIIPECQGNFADQQVAGFRSGDFAFAVD